MNSRNVTIDNAANSTLIAYQPPFCNGTGWAVNQKQGFGGSYTSCTTSGDVLPSANLSFTGVAIYYISPTFEGASMQFRLDGVSSDDISLSTPSGQSTNKTDTRIMWQQTGLENKAHMLEIIPRNGSTTLNVDAFIVTEVDTVTANNATVSPATPSTPSGAGLTLPTQSKSTTRLSIGLGTTFGALSLIIFFAIAWSMSRRTRQQRNRFEWAKPFPPLIRDDRVTTTFDRLAFAEGSQRSPTSAKTENESGVPMHPIPPNNISHDSISVRDFENDDHPDNNTEHNWGSPTPSNINLLHNRASSSEGHGDAYALVSRHPTFVSKLEPVRASSVASTSHHTSYTHSSLVDRNPAFLSRAPTYTSKLEPVRASSPPSNAQTTTLSHYSTGDPGASVSRNTTFSSKLEPVRRGT